MDKITLLISPHLAEWSIDYARSLKRSGSRGELIRDEIVKLLENPEKLGGVLDRVILKAKAQDTKKQTPVPVYLDPNDIIKLDELLSKGWLSRNTLANLLLEDLKLTVEEEATA